MKESRNSFVFYIMNDSDLQLSYAEDNLKISGMIRVLKLLFHLPDNEFYRIHRLLNGETEDGKIKC